MTDVNPKYVPRRGVFEATLGCNLRCRHCGSRAGRPRPDELSTDEWLEVIDRLDHLRCQRITLLGGEPLARPDWVVLARESVKRGMDVIIAISFGREITGEPSGFFEYFSSFISRTYTLSERREMALAIDLHHHEIVIVNVQFDQIIQIWDVEAVPAILEAGQKAVERRKKEILSAIKSFRGAK